MKNLWTELLIVLKLRYRNYCYCGEIVVSKSKGLIYKCSNCTLREKFTKHAIWDLLYEDVPLFKPCEDSKFLTTFTKSGKTLTLGDL